MSQKESEWEKKWNDGIRPCVWDEVADFITAIVSNREKEIAEEVEKKRRFQIEETESDDVARNSNNMTMAYNEGLDTVLQILNHK